MKKLLAALAILAASLVAGSATGTAAAGLCDGQAVTIEGTSGPDLLVGTPGPDVIHGYGGNDRIQGRGGDDILCGGLGDDEIDGGLGNDRILGGGGNDVITPKRGDDEVDGGPGSDEVSFASSPGPVTVNLRATTATGEGTDTVWGIERVIGSRFDDVLVGTARGERFSGGDGNDRIRARGGDDLLNGDRGRDLLNGGGGEDVCESGARYRSCLLDLELTLIADIGGAGGVAVTPPADADLIVVGQSGILWRVPIAGGDPTVFLDISERVGDGGELGLLGVAFHPDFETNGRFFVDYTANDARITISEFAVIAKASVADPDSEQVLLTIDRPYPGYTNHNGGMLAFGPDGYLYASVGDGGRGGDPDGHGQNIATLLGSILRLDVDTGDPYGIPAGNPFAETAGADEIWAYGLRNPWRMSFDPLTGDLWIGDVGQGSWEEVSIAPAGVAGLNFGWSTMEGTHCYSPATGCSQTGITLPIHEYETRRAEDNTCSVIGGEVYRGSTIPELRGRYLFADYCAGWIESLRATASGGSTEHVQWISPGESPFGKVTSFGVDGSGELYVVTIDGEVLRIDPVR